MHMNIHVHVEALDFVTSEARFALFISLRISEMLRRIHVSHLLFSEILREIKSAKRASGCRMQFIPPLIKQRSQIWTTYNLHK